MKTRRILYADEGKVFTDGANYGKIIYLADDASAEAYYQIADEEYQEILKAQEQSNKMNYDI